MEALSMIRRVMKALKRLVLCGGVIFVLMLALVLIRYNVAAERSRSLSKLQRLLRLNEPSEREKVGNVEVIGHRGSGDGRENTRGAIGFGIGNQVDWIEIDVRKCGDELILFHDETIDGWLIAMGKDDYEGERVVRNLSLGTLRQIQGDAGRNDEVLSLEELFVDHRQSGDEVRWVIDVKEDGIGGEIRECLRRNGFENQRHRVVLLGIFDIIEDYRESGYALAYAAGVTEGANIPRFLFGHSFIVERCVDLGATLEYLALPEMFLNAGLLEAVGKKKPGLKIWTYIGETPESWRRSIRFGVDGLIVDHVREARELVDESGFLSTEALRRANGDRRGS